MNPLLQYLLVLHVIAGLLGVIALYAAWMQLLRREPLLKFARRTTLSAAIFFIISWLTGGYYYVVWYGNSVKANIKTGAAPWAHNFVMETKEHVFLFLPFLALAAAFVLYGFKEGSLQPPLKRPVSALLGLATILGIVVTVAGFVISGSVRT